MAPVIYPETALRTLGSSVRMTHATVRIRWTAVCPAMSAPPEDGLNIEVGIHQLLGRLDGVPEDVLRPESHDHREDQKPGDRQEKPPVAVSRLTPFPACEARLAPEGVAENLDHREEREEADHDRHDDDAVA